MAKRVLLYFLRPRLTRKWKLGRLLSLKTLFGPPKIIVWSPQNPCFVPSNSKSMVPLKWLFCPLKFRLWGPNTLFSPKNHCLVPPKSLFSSLNLYQNIQSAFHIGPQISSSGRNGTSTQWLSIFQCAKSSAPCDSPSPSLSTWPVESPAAQDAQQICMSPPGLLPQTSFIFFTLKVCKVYFQLIWGPGKLSRVASTVDIIDQLSTTFKICLCTMYIENVLDYPSQLY